MKNKITPIETAKITFKNKVPYLMPWNTPYLSSVMTQEKRKTILKNTHFLPHRFSNNKRLYVVGEIGFGAAINFLLTWALWDKNSFSNQQLHYIASEKMPLSKQDLKNILTAFPELSFYAKQLLDVYPLLTPGFHRINFSNISLTLLLGEESDLFEDYLVDDEEKTLSEFHTFSFDCWFVNTPPCHIIDLVNTERLLKTITLLSTNTTTLSFEDAAIEKKFLSDRIKSPTHKRSIFKGAPWQCANVGTPLKPHHSIAIVGAGLAGSIMAYRLAQRGFKVTLFEKNTDIATKGSGNALGMVHFKLSAFHSPLNDFMLMSFLYALRFYEPIDTINRIEGIADLLSKEAWNKKKEDLKELATHYPQLITFLSSKEITNIANIPLLKPALYWPKGLMLSPIKCCKKLTSDKNITLIKNQNINIDDLNFDKVIICTGTSTMKIAGLNYLPIKSVSGMVSYFSPSYETEKLTIGLSLKGYLTPLSANKKHVIGGSYHIESVSQAHQAHLNYAIEISDHFSGLKNPTHKSGNRAKTYDYLPFVGSLPDVEKFYKLYAPFRKDKNLCIKNKPPYLKNNSILTGFGSHGLTTIPLSAEILLCQLLNEPLPISQTMLKTLSPARVLIKNIIKNQ